MSQFVISCLLMGRLFCLFSLNKLNANSSTVMSRIKICVVFIGANGLCCCFMFLIWFNPNLTSVMLKLMSRGILCRTMCLCKLVRDVYMYVNKLIKHIYTNYIAS